MKGRFGVGAVVFLLLGAVACAVDPGSADDLGSSLDPLHRGRCGNGVCNINETCSSCAKDCGICKPPPAPTPTPSAPPPPPPTPGSGADIVDGSLQVVPSAYVAMASSLSKDAGLAYRYGPDAISYGTANTGVTLTKRPDTKLTAPAQDVEFYWSVGGPPTSDAGLYSSNQATVIYAADDTSQRVGVTDFQVSGYMYNVFAELPQLSWTRLLVDSLNVTTYQQAGIVSSDPIATGRCGGRPGFCAQALTAFQNGVIGSTGSNTANNRTTTKLPANKVPTGIAMTNDSEFALVTVWDTQAMKGQVAVVALAGLCDGCTADNPAGWYDWWGEWMGLYPGLPNMGDIAFMKILGYVDLPGMTAPTEIAVTTGLDQFHSLSVNGVFVGRVNSPLTSYWQTFASGGDNYGKYAKGGVAVVISKSEQKAAFIDLKPLFSYVNGKYFSASVNETTNLGQAANQWPYTFDVAPEQTPTVVKTVSLNARPTAVRTTLLDRNPRAWIATQDGTLHVYGLDGYAPGSSVTSPAASAIAEVSTVTGIGRNPTSLAMSKGEPGVDLDSTNQVIVGSRGDNKISWVRFDASGNGGSIVRTIQHVAMTDLIAVEDADDFATTNYVVSALDYAGKAVRNYRYGPVIYAGGGGACPEPNGCPIDGSVAEYGGAMSVQGKPFQMTTANVP
jgi:hypothetical protein